MSSVRSGLASTNFQSKSSKSNWWFKRVGRNSFLFKHHDNHNLRNGVIFWNKWSLFPIKSCVPRIRTVRRGLVNTFGNLKYRRILKALNIPLETWQKKYIYRLARGPNLWSFWPRPMIWGGGGTYASTIALRVVKRWWKENPVPGITGPSCSWGI
jgi:hypothetical protein